MPQLREALVSLPSLAAKKLRLTCCLVSLPQGAVGPQAAHPPGRIMDGGRGDRDHRAP